MSLRTLCLTLLVVACLLILVLPVQAESDDRSSVNVIYQTTFSSDPHWTTNSPSSDYWDPSTGRYHFSIEPSTGNYAYTTIDNLDGPFTFEYDVILDRVDDDATFRFGLTGAEMDFNKGPNVFSLFTNGKHDRIMWLHLVTTGSKQMEVNSQSDDELTSGSIAYKGPTVRYELNKTYSVVINYEEELKTLTMRVNDKATGREVWAYFLKTVESVRGMNRIYLGSRGDYGSMYVYASGYIDNVRLTQPGPAITPEQTLVSPETTPPRVTTRKPTVLPTPLPTDTPESPADSILAVLALGIIGTVLVIRGRKKY
ncbi:MAG: hypothetical protein EHM53_03410 [Methanoregulaceae archaeon]|nr:MAG: hypothetical protein EHM53_03410 [Methanoregulaceae archaeon]